MRDFHPKFSTKNLFNMNGLGRGLWVHLWWFSYQQVTHSPNHSYTKTTLSQMMFLIKWLRAVRLTDCCTQVKLLITALIDNLTQVKRFVCFMWQLKIHVTEFHNQNVSVLTQNKKWNQCVCLWVCVSACVLVRVCVVSSCAASICFCWTKFILFKLKNSGSLGADM